MRRASPAPTIRTQVSAAASKIKPLGRAKLRAATTLAALGKTGSQGVARGLPVRSKIIGYRGRAVGTISFRYTREIEAEVIKMARLMGADTITLRRAETWCDDRYLIAVITGPAITTHMGMTGITAEQVWDEEGKVMTIKYKLAPENRGGN